MCGIVGLFSLSDQNNKFCKKDSLINSLNLIKHRGPDELSGVIDKNFFLGNARLAIEAIKFGKQPFFSSDKKIVLVFNGEIFNYKNLINEHFKNTSIKSEGDLIISLFQKFGSNFVKKIKGQFAIFIYDKNTEEIFLFRDRYGIRPIYYFFKKKCFLFGSEIKTIVSSKIEKFTINPSSLEDTAVFWTNISDSSSIKDIKVLEPGCYLRIRNNKIFKGRYFINPILSKKNNNLSLNKNDFLEKFQSAIKNQIHGDPWDRFL